MTTTGLAVVSPRQQALSILKGARHIVVVYSSADLSIVSRLARRIRRLRRDASGRTVFMAGDSLPIAKDVSPDDIRREIARADLVVVACGKDTWRSAFVKEEISQALEQRLRNDTEILPVILTAGVTLPTGLDFAIQAINRNTLFPADRWLPIGVAVAVALLAVLAIAFGRQRQLVANDAAAGEHWKEGVKARDTNQDVIAAAHWFAQASDRGASKISWQNAALAAEYAIGALRLDELTPMPGVVRGVTLDAERTRALIWTKDSAELWSLTPWQRIAPPVTLPSKEPIDVVRFDRTSQRLAVVGNDGTILLWDPGAHKEVLVGNHGGHVFDALITTDATRIVSYGPNREIKIWNGEQRQQGPLATIPVAETINGATLDSRGRLLTWSSYTVKLWNLADARPTWTMPNTGSQIVSMDLMPDGEHVLVATTSSVSVWLPGSAKAAWVWDRSSVENVRIVSNWPTDPINRIVFKDGDSIRFLDAATGTAVDASVEHPNLARFSVDPLHGQLVTWDRDGTVALWDSAFTVVGHTFAIKNLISVDFSDDGRQLVTSSSDQVVRIWSANTQELIGTLVHGGSRPPTAELYDNGRRLLTWSSDEDVVRTSRLLAMSGGTHHIPNVGDMALRDDGTAIAAFSGDGVIRILDRLTLKTIAESRLQHTDVEHIAYSASQKTLLLWGRAYFELLNAVTLKRIATEPNIMKDVIGISVGPSRRSFSTWTKARSIRTWDMETGAPLGRLVQESDDVVGVATDADVTTVASWDANRIRAHRIKDGALIGSLPVEHTVGAKFDHASPTLTIWRSGERTLAQRWTIGASRSEGEFSVEETAPVHDLALSPDARLLLVRTLIAGVTLWDTSSRQRLGALAALGAHYAGFDPSGQRLVLVEQDARLSLTDVGTRDSLGVPLPHERFSGASFYPDGARLFAWGDDVVATIDILPISWPFGDARRNVEVATGTKLLPDGRVMPLDSETWRTLKAATK